MPTCKWKPKFANLTSKFKKSIQKNRRWIGPESQRQDMEEDENHVFSEMTLRNMERY